MNLDQELLHAIGITKRELDRVNARRVDMPNAYFNKIVRVIDHSDLLHWLQEEQAKHRKSNAGRKAALDSRAIIVIFLITNLFGYGTLYTEAVNTLQYRLTPEQRTLLGISNVNFDQQNWYHAIWRGMRRILIPLDPWYQTQRHRKLTGAEYQHALAIKDAAREDLANEMANLLIRTTIELLPKKFLKGYNGDVSLDATFFKVGEHGNSKDPTKDRRNINFCGGHYGRTDGTYPEFAFGFEVDTMILADTKNGNFPFPLITGAIVHLPGYITRAGRDAVAAHQRCFGFPGILIVDRAYNGLIPEHFQEFIRKLGYETVYKYPKTKLGFQAKVPGLPFILVDGNLYLETMPRHLQQFFKWRENNKPNPATGELMTPELVKTYKAERSKYRLKPHGRPDGDAHQRYSLPENTHLLDHRNPIDDRPCDPPVYGYKTVTIPSSPDIVRHIQKEEYESKQWFFLAGQRNHVENSNRDLKRVEGANLGEPKKRLGRGITFQTLAAGFAIAAENIRRIIRGIITVVNESLAQEQPGKARRARRRTDMYGNRLPKQPDHPTHNSPETPLRT